MLAARSFNTVFGGILHKGIQSNSFVVPTRGLEIGPRFEGSSSEVNQSNEGKTMEVVTSLPFLSAALSKKKKQKLR